MRAETNRESSLATDWATFMMVRMFAASFAAAGQCRRPTLSGSDSAWSIGVDSREFDHHRQPLSGIV